MAFELPDLPYAYDALQPFMSRETFEFHQDKHHKAYVDQANQLLQGSPLEGKSVEEVVKASAADPALKPLFNNAGQHWNHSQFWLSMKPNGGSASVPGELLARIESDLGGLEKFKQDFITTGVKTFGSGWVWLVTNAGKLEIVSTSNADTPLVQGKTALFTCDVWEHAYYIDYRNLRQKFLTAFLDSLVNWERAAELYAKSA